MLPLHSLPGRPRGLSVYLYPSLYTEEDPAENFPTVGQAVLGTALIFLLENLRAQSFTINSGLDLRILSVL